MILVKTIQLWRPYMPGLPGNKQGGNPAQQYRDYEY
jgi:hypothetical protein